MSFCPATAGDQSTFSQWHREGVFLCPDLDKNLIA